MKFALFLGCKIPHHLSQYGLATRSLLNALEIEIVEPEFSCCGYPTRTLHFEAFLLSAAKNLALAEKSGTDILTPCKCCFGSLKHAVHWLKNDSTLRKKINGYLKDDNLHWGGRIAVKHLLTVLTHDIGLDALQKRIKRPYKGLKIAAHYGCHALRPGNVVQFDNPLAPTIFEKLIDITGAESVEWPRRLECCGYPIWGKNNPLALDLMQKKLIDAKQVGADYLCSACTYCQIQFDTIQYQEVNPKGLASILYPQLLGLTLGIPEDQLGLALNKLPISNVQQFLI